MQCKLCKRRAKNDEGLCRYHSEARAALRRAYETWSRALLGISWEDYLNRVKTVDGAGEWIKEVIALEQEIGGSE